MIPRSIIINTLTKQYHKTYHTPDTPTSNPHFTINDIRRWKISEIANELGISREFTENKKQIDEKYKKTE